MKTNEHVNYLIGLIVSDGNLQLSRPRIIFTNSDMELIHHVRDIVKEYITGREYKIQEQTKGDSKWYAYQFTSRVFYNYLKEIGVHPNKSLNISKVNIEKRFFADFLRGVIDGDGCFCKDGGGRVVTSIVSGSLDFLQWLFLKINIIIKPNGGFISRNHRCYALRYSKKDTRKIVRYIYPNSTYFSSYKKKRVEEYLH